MTDDRAPILIGAGQFVQRDVEPDAALDPIAMMATCARTAADDARAGNKLLAALDAVKVVNVFCYPYGNTPRLLAEQVGAHPRLEIDTTIGGNTPQWLVNETAAEIRDGKVELALIAGAEAVRTVGQARRKRVTLAWGGGDGKPTVVGDPRDGTTAHEIAHGLMLPTAIYPMFENAIRARRGWTLDEHRRRLGELCARFAAVAATHPQAWFRDAASAERITTVDDDNRMIGFPYPKRMNAILAVDQAAAVLMTSVGKARALGIPESRWVHLWGGADAHDKWFVSDRVEYSRSPAIAVAGRAALDAAGIGIDAVDHFDLYSCFPSAVQLGRDALGIGLDDPRALTVTGGLPYFGGPGNNYSTHGIATMMDRMRERPGTIGLVTALGWYVTKHSVGIYGTEPPAKPWRPTDKRALQQEIDAMPSPELALDPDGPGRIETYTVLYDRDGAPMRGLVIGRLDDGRRFLANTPQDAATFERLTTSEGVGLPGRARRDGETNRFELA